MGWNWFFFSTSPSFKISVILKMEFVDLKIETGITWRGLCTHCDYLLNSENLLNGLLKGELGVAQEIRVNQYKIVLSMFIYFCLWTILLGGFCLQQIEFRLHSTPPSRPTTFNYQPLVSFWNSPNWVLDFKVCNLLCKFKIWSIIFSFCDKFFKTKLLSPFIIFLW